ncbi:MAG: DUF86 domain-containing protein [Candidatus Beckwithbacteria bacterium]|nr:DUF86 domain-containing protein [Patescibacteria group bacterium]
MKQPNPYLSHIIESFDKIDILLHGFTKEKFVKDERTQLAIIKLLEIIGEACVHLKIDFYKSHPEIPWAKIISMRNRLTHEYWEIDLDIVWKTVKERVPELRKQLESLVKLN